jgi:hypothetical protein
MPRSRSRPVSSSTPTELEYQWPRYETGPDRHMHALGVIAINYNIFEFRLAFLLQYYATPPVSDFFFDKIHNEERVEAIAHFAKLKERDPAVLALIHHLLAYFGTCVQNRNILMHSQHSQESRSDDTLPLEKKSANDSTKLLYFHLLLPHLRRVADQTMRGVSFLQELLDYLRARDAAPSAELFAAQHPLPKKPRAPRQLAPSPSVPVPAPAPEPT